MLIDSSGPRLVCALVDQDGAVYDLRRGEHLARPGAEQFSAPTQERVGQVPTPTQIPTELIPSGLDSIVVGVGPGSFIGTRTAISFANGYAAASPTSVALYGVNSLAAIAASYGTGSAVLRDARRGQWYLWTQDGQCSVESEGSLEEVLRPRAVSQLLLEAVSQPAWFAQLSSRIFLQLVPGPTPTGLLAAAVGLEPQPYVEPIYLRGFT